MFSSAGANPLALCIAWKKPSDDRPHALKNPRPAGAESTLTENVASPFHAEPRHSKGPHLQAKLALSVVIVFALGLPARSLISPFETRFTAFEQIRDLMETMSSAGAPDIPAVEIKDAASWDNWIRARDREIRGRIDRGMEDSIANLILFGTSYCRLPPIPGAAQSLNTQGELTSAALERVHALTLASRQPGDNERARFVRDFLQRKKVAGNKQVIVTGIDTLLQARCEESPKVCSLALPKNCEMNRR